MIGHDPSTVEGETTVKLRDNAGQPAGRVSFTGTPEPLTIVNAEDLRQRINQMWDVDKTKQTQGLKPLIDDAVQKFRKAVSNPKSTNVADLGNALYKLTIGKIAPALGGASEVLLAPDGTLNVDMGDLNEPDPNPSPDATPMADLLSEKIWKPYGMEKDAVWMIDDAGHEFSGCCISARNRHARLGVYGLKSGKTPKLGRHRVWGPA